MASASFVELSHQYECDGISIPSVTQVLSLTGIDDVSRIPLHVLERAAAIGTAVHLACEYLDQDSLDLDSVDPKLTGYILAYQRFRAESGFVPELIEHRAVGILAGLHYGFCVDRMGYINGQRIILDLKTSSKPYASWAIQTAAYALGLGCTEVRRAAVKLAKDGTYKLLEHADSVHDARTWEAALVIAHWRLAHRTDGNGKLQLADKLNQGEVLR
jgi:hypothetical protein